MKWLAGFILIMVFPVLVAYAGEADVLQAKVSKESGKIYRFVVTVQHEDTGWKHYADKVITVNLPEESLQIKGG